MIILFTNAFDGNANDLIGINVEKIISVYEIIDPTDKKKKRKLTNLYCGGDLNFTVKESIDEVMLKLDQK